VRRSLNKGKRPSDRLQISSVRRIEVRINARGRILYSCWWMKDHGIPSQHSAAGSSQWLTSRADFRRRPRQIRPDPAPLSSFLLSGGVFSKIGGDFAYDINDAGQIVGQDGLSGFLLDGKVRTAINFPGATVTAPRLQNCFVTVLVHRHLEIPPVTTSRASCHSAGLRNDRGRAPG
jgi:hypothetical protein